MDRKKVQAWLEEKLDDPDIIRETEGTANINVFVKSDLRYVLRISKDISKDRLGNEFRTLQFLEKQGIANVPQAVKFGDIEGKNVLLETAVGQNRTETEDFNQRRLEDLAGLLARIHSIPADDYRQFFNADKESKASLKDIMREDFVKWGKKPYREYVNRVEDPDSRLERLFKLQRKLPGRIEDVEVDRTIVHGDLGENIRHTGGETFIVDWELSRLGYPGMELLYFLYRHNLEDKKEKLFLDSYRDIRNLGDGFKELKDIYPCFLAFNDAAWAAKRFARSGDEKYQRMLDRRIEKAEKLFKVN